VSSPRDGLGRIAPRVLRAFALALALAGCTGDETLLNAAPPPEPVDGGAQTAPPPAAVVIDQEDATQGGPKTEIFTSDDSQSLPPTRRSKKGGEPGDVTLDFADADIKDVIRAVLGDILKVAFSIDPQIQGKVTLKTSEPLRKEDVIAALETALKVNGAVILLADGVYNVAPAAEAQKRIDGFDVSGSPRARQPGFGVEIVPLRFIAAAEMKKILDPLAPTGGVLTVDLPRNFIFISGTGQERASMLETIRIFDVDYMRGMSYALVRPDHVDAPALAQELGRVFASTRGPGAGVVRFVSLPRLNTLLIVSPRAALLKDVPPTGPGRRIYYYRLQNAKAEDVARSLSAVYGTTFIGGDSGSSSSDGADNGMDATQPPPGDPAAVPPQAQPGANGGLRGSTSGGPHIAIDTTNNALIIRAEGSEYASLERFLREIDVAPDQVMIEVTIAEVTLNDSLKYGVEWFFTHAGEKFQLSKAAAVAVSRPGFTFSYVVPEVEVALSALGSVTDVKVIMSNKLLTLNNKAADLQVGDQVPVITQSASGIRSDGDLTVVNSVQMRDTGVLLKVTPRIGKSGMVFVDVRQEVSNAVATSSSGIDSPTIQQRKLTNTVAVHDGATVALGGLIRDSVNYGDSGVPYLKDIPLFGKLFSSTTAGGERTELLIFLRPRIIRDPAAAREMTDELRSGLHGLDKMMDAADARKLGGAKKAN
jgi:general secretion pathway protein D